MSYVISETPKAIEKRVKRSKLLALKLDDDLSPVFQLNKNPGKPTILQGVEKVLLHRSRFSDIMSYNVFISEHAVLIERLPDKDTVKVINILRKSSEVINIHTGQ